MSERKQNSMDDSEFDRELALTSRAYKSAESDLPPPAMDDAIRAAARRAVKSQPHPVGKSWIARYSAPLSAAALVMLTVSIGFVAMEERPELAPARLTEGVRPGVTTPAAAAMGAPETAAPEVVQSPVGVPMAPTPEKKAMRERSAYAAQERLTSPKTDSAQRPNEVAVAAPVAVGKTTPTFVADPAPVADTRREKRAENAELSKQEMSPEKQAIGSITGAGLSARNDAPRPAQKVAAPASAAAMIAPSVTSRSAATPQAYAPPAPPAPLASMADTADEPPEKWLKRILELKQVGKTRESDEELAKFRKRYPDYVLPEALKAQK